MGGLSAAAVRTVHVGHLSDAQFEGDQLRAEGRAWSGGGSHPVLHLRIGRGGAAGDGRDWRCDGSHQVRVLAGGGVLCAVVRRPAAELDLRSHARRARAAESLGVRAAARVCVTWQRGSRTRDAPLTRQFGLIRFSTSRYSRMVVFSREPEIEISSAVNVPFAVL